MSAPGAPPAERIKAEAFALGFDLAGIVRLGPAPTAPAFEQWLARGYAGTMAYLERGAAARRDTRSPLPGMRSAVVVAADYGGREPSGPVARYARGADYHDVLKGHLATLHRWIEAQSGQPVAGKPYVDTGPLLERDLARQAGLGWFGKNTCLINPSIGSYFFIGVLLLDLELPADAPFQTDHCGTCTRCLDACPTGALVEPGVLDARRCISYLTIELRDGIPEALRERMGSLLFGCDICQEVCPWNVKFARPLPADSPFAPREALRDADGPTLARQLLGLSPEEFSASFRGSPLKRARLAGLKRNAAVVLGNRGAAADVPVLEGACQAPADIAGEHALWALARLAGRRTGS